ncbi:sialidase [Paenisporosarcina quisquiliarum]|uniref:Sialidase n=1 Tax=Paenisporosarcina quisquiliarum TaxID=365346 RepID=A0A9X3LGK5_9BACL|nr:sialidase [Paenisporosarcina quisquiliarum]MCZ8537592.1 sialidase [Paenisporosarcina quisquiliarum]
MKKQILMVGLVSVMLAACSSNEKTEHNEHKVDKATQENPSSPSKDFYKETTDVQVSHIHGLGYPSSGDALMLATHRGPVTYENGVWKETTGEKHDYMGFQAVADGFVSSGHPEPGSDYKNPLGLLKSTNAGETFEQYAFEGEIDFHYLAAGYNTDRIYVFNEMPTKKLGNGFYYSDDLGQAWTAMEMGGFEANMMSNITAHPDEPETIAIGTDRGLYVSKDAGKTFSLATKGKMITYALLGKQHAYVAELVDDQVQLNQINLSSKEEKTMATPKLKKDNAIIYIAVHPTDDKEISIATLQNDVYQSTDGGATWTQILAAGTVSN